MTTPTAPLPTFTLTDVFTKGARTFASAKIEGGDYVVRRGYLKAIAAATPADLQVFGESKLRGLFSLLIREVRRYAGTHKHSDGTIVRLTFSASAKHKASQRAVWYYGDLKAAGAAVRAALPELPKPAPEQLSLEQLAAEAATAFAE